MKYNNLIFVILCVVLFANLAHPAYSTASQFLLENTVNEKEVKFENNIQSQFITEDQSDKITELYIILENNGFQNNTAMMISFERNTTYIIQTNKYYYLGVLPYMELSQRLVVNNYTVFNKTTQENNVIPGNIVVKYRWDFESTNTTIQTGNFLQTSDISNITYSTESTIGLPSGNVTIAAMSPFIVRITYDDINRKISIQAKKDTLSPVSILLYYIINSVYKLLSLNINADSELLLNMLALLDYLFFFLQIVFLIVVRYPYLVMVWVLIAGNFYVAWKSNNLSTIVMNYKEFYAGFFNAVYVLALNVWNIIVQLFQALRG